MSESDFITWAYKAGWSGVALLLSYSVYLGTKHMAPVWAERYKAQTHCISAKDEKRAESLVQKLRVNGAEMRVIEDQLIGSLRFKELFFDARLAASHRFRTLEGEQTSLEGKLDEHVEEDQAVHERVKALEVRVEDMKADVQEIKEVIRDGAKTVAEEAKAIRKEMAEGERRVLDAVRELHERRKEPRA